MSSLCFDANGNRIQTDVLVSGYIREFTNECNSDIPSDIIKLCFLFWFIDVCDEWDKSLCHQLVDINGGCFKLSDNIAFSDKIYCCTAFGTHTVDHGIFVWRMKFKTNMTWICIGVIPDKSDLLKEEQIDNAYGRFSAKGGCFLLNMNGVIYHGGIDKYCDVFTAKDTVIEMTLDMDKHTISYKVNGTDCGIAYDKLNEKRYRLAVTIADLKHEIELI